MPTISNTPTVQVSVPVPTPVQQQPKTRQPVSFGLEDDTTPLSPTVPNVPRQRRILNSVILPWHPPPKQMMRSATSMKRLPKRVIRFASHSQELQQLLAAARSNPDDHTLHGAIADKLEELYPDSPIHKLIRQQYGLGEYGGAGEKGGRDDFGPFYNSFDGTFPYHARLGIHGPFNLYLGHNPEDHNSRWVVRAISRLKGSRDSGYTFEFPHEEAHLIPQMFPAAQLHISPYEGPHRAKREAFPGQENPPFYTYPPDEWRQREADRFHNEMNSVEE